MAPLAIFYFVCLLFIFCFQLFKKNLFYFFSQNYHLFHSFSHWTISFNKSALTEKQTKFFFQNFVVEIIHQYQLKVLNHLVLFYFIVKKISIFHFFEWSSCLSRLFILSEWHHCLWKILFIFNTFVCLLKRWLSLGI